MVAHRLSTIENADKIVVLDKGKVLAIGKDEELLQTCSLYQNLKAKKKQSPALVNFS